MPAFNPSPLQQLRQKIQQKTAEDFNATYCIPGRWLSIKNAPNVVQVKPYHVWLNMIDWILEQPATPCVTNPEAQGGAWSRYAVVYNLFVRTATAFDHDQDGELGRPNEANLSEVGTFVKSILLLRYIKQLGCNTVHMLPITSVGQDGSKGDMGSPYAIRNPYKLDENLAEPSLDLGVEAEFAAFVEAAHHLGIRVVMEFVFRTSSKDGDWVKEHPEWFYWINAGIPDRTPITQDETHYGMPIFTKNEIKKIETKVEQEIFSHLTPPHKKHQQMFLLPPTPDQVEMIGGKWIATYESGNQGRIPGAFADWPVDDPQPPWGDVTYLRLYDHPDFNYISYNTIRMYSEELAQPANIVQPLWEHIINIIPHYQKNFGIDGAMIDMGHALPTPLKQALVAKARANNPDFAFWDENFQAKQIAVEEGYNAVIGSLPFMLMAHNELESYTKNLAYNGTPLPIFNTTESHNTPRAITKEGGERYVKYGISVGTFMPAIPFIHNGVEFGESKPINTGLRFTEAEMAQFPSHTLPLFSAVPLDWTNDTTSLTQWWQKTLQLRKPHVQLLSDTSKQTFIYMFTDNPNIWGIIRHTHDWTTKLALISNRHMLHTESVKVGLPTGRDKLMDHYTNTFFDVQHGHIEITLNPGQSIWLEL